MPRVTHFEIHADNTERARQFYTAVFNWQFEKHAGPHEYWAIVTGSNDEPGINGGLLPRRTPVDGNGVGSYICTVDVSSVEASLEMIVAHGGTLALAKMEIPAGGWLAYARDPDGNVFGLMERATQ